MSEERTVCRTPTEGKKPTSIPTWKYEAIRGAILAVVPEEPPGVPFGELPKLVESRLPRGDRDRLGSVSWHTTTVKLDMEVRGELARVSGAGPQRLVKTSGNC